MSSACHLLILLWQIFNIDFFYFSIIEKGSVKQPSIEKSKQIFDIQILS